MVVKLKIKRFLVKSERYIQLNCVDLTNHN